MLRTIDSTTINNNINICSKEIKLDGSKTKKLNKLMTT